MLPSGNGRVMLTDRRIQRLLDSSKTISKKKPARGYKDENRHKRWDLELEITSDRVLTLTVFVRQSIQFIENFSLGPRYQTNDPTLGAITLVRYNGPHGEFSKHPDGRRTKPHIHRITAAEIANRNTQPQEKHRETTDRYRTFEEALAVFFRDIGATNFMDYFPASELLQGRLFNGHR